MGSWLGLLLLQEDFTYPSDHLPHLRGPRLTQSQSATGQKGGNGHQKPQIRLMKGTHYYTGVFARKAQMFPLNCDYDPKQVFRFGIIQEVNVFL